MMEELLDEDSFEFKQEITAVANDFLLKNANIQLLIAFSGACFWVLGAVGFYSEFGHKVFNWERYISDFKRMLPVACTFILIIIGALALFFLVLSALNARKYIQTDTISLYEKALNYQAKFWQFFIPMALSVGGLWGMLFLDLIHREFWGSNLFF